MENEALPREDDEWSHKWTKCRLIFRSSDHDKDFRTKRWRTGSELHNTAAAH